MIRSPLPICLFATPAPADGSLSPTGQPHQPPQRWRSHAGAAALGLIGALLLAGASVRAQQFSFSTVALSGEHAPGTAAGVNYSGFITPALNAAGQSAFGATLTGIGVTSTNDSGLWLGAPGDVALLAREGNPAPGTAAGVNYSDLRFIDPALNAAGQSAFVVEVTGPGVTSANDLGLWSGAPGSVALLAREGNPAPGTAAGVNYSDLRFGPLTLNTAGQSAFRGLVAGPGVTNANDYGLWSGAPGGVTLFAREDDLAPGTTGGVRYTNLFGPPALNAGGGSVFFAELTGPGVTSANNSGFWSGGPGFRQALVVREGDPAPGTAAGVNFSGFDSNAARNAAGESAFAAGVAGPGVTTANDSGLWSTASGGSLVKIVYEGDAAPGAGVGTLFGDADNSFSTRTPFALNDRRQVVFLNYLIGPNVTSENDGSLWFADKAGALSLIVREGDSFEVAPGDMRILSSISFDGGSGDEDGLFCGFNDLGQVAFHATFTDGSQGIFIATLPALQLTAAVSRKEHGGNGPFDINLPLAGAPGVECRSSGGIHTLVFSFTNNVVNGNASVTSGAGVAGSPTFFGKRMIVGLSSVADVQKITLALSNVTDNFDQVLPATAVSMNMLIGDTTGNKIVNASDISQTKGQSGMPVTTTNFRQDVTVSGTINASDIGLVKSRSGSGLP